MGKVTVVSRLVSLLFPHCGYIPTAIQRAVSFALQPDAVTAVNELRVIACSDNGFCQYDDPSLSTYVATTAKQRVGNVIGYAVA